MLAPDTCKYLSTRLPQLQHRLSRVLVDPQQSRHRTSSTRRQRPTAILLITSVTFWIRSIPRHLRGYTSTLRVCFQVLDMNSCLPCMNNTIFDCSILFALIFTDSLHPHFGGPSVGATSKMPWSALWLNRGFNRFQSFKLN